MTELALITPVLLLILFAIVQFGIAFHNYVALTDAVRAGARTAAVSRQSPTRVPDTISKVKSASGDLDPSKPGFDVTVASDWLHGDDVVVTAKYPLSINLLGIPLGPDHITSTSTERVE